MTISVQQNSRPVSDQLVKESAILLQAIIKELVRNFGYLYWTGCSADTPAQHDYLCT